MDNDDKPVGRILTRREILKLFGFAGATLLAGCGTQTPPTVSVRPAAAQPPGTAATAVAQMQTTATAASATATPTSAATALTVSSAAAIPSCVVSPALTEGPYFVDEKLNRSDIRSDPSDGSVKDGLPLALTIRVSRVGSGGCAPLAGATVDIWHCDALGVYSDASDPTFNTKGKKFLRGYQVTDAQGLVHFTTIYPGWYQGRAVHIHFKVRAPNSAGKMLDFTSQWFFDDALNAQVFRVAPYASKGNGWLRNASDGIYRDSGGQTILAAAKSGAGYAATFDLGMKL